MMKKSAIVIGAGIVGLAVARAFAIRGFTVTVIERSSKSVGASVRNFGMVLPIAQPDGILFERAMNSRRIWKSLCDDAKIWYDEVGSLQLSYAADEWQVLSELSDIYKHRGYQLLNSEQTCSLSYPIVPRNLHGSLFSKDEIIVDPREAIYKIPEFLSERYGVQFIWNTTATSITRHTVFAGSKSYSADEIFVCSGSDFETLFPEQFANQNITKCKLQMMRMAAQDQHARIGPMLCAGLSLINYSSFSVAPTHAQLKARLHLDFPEYIKWGIHVMVSQNQTGELTIGDSHEYGLTPDPWDRALVNELILNYLKNFAAFKNEKVIETWNGVYSKMKSGETELVIKPEDGITIVNGLGGAGMTLSFGLAEEIVS